MELQILFFWPLMKTWLLKVTSCEDLSGPCVDKALETGKKMKIFVFGDAKK